MPNKFSTYIVWLCLGTLLVSACVNRIEFLEDTDDNQETTDIPILLKDATLQEYVYNKSRICRSGLFVIKNLKELDEERLIDNTPCVIGKDGITPENTSVYPNESDKFTFVSYFPFAETGVEKGSNSMTVKVSDAQDDNEEFIASDFMVCRKENISASSKAVTLEHGHELAMLCASIEVLGDGTPEELLELNPSITFDGLYTQGTYHFDTAEYELEESSEAVVPHGSWKAEGLLLTGKEAIVLPQVLAPGVRIATLTIGEKTFECKLSEELYLQKGKNTRITIQYHPTKGVGVIIPSINNWGEGDIAEITPEERIETEHIKPSALDLRNQPVYGIYHKGEKLAEVCLEYISTRTIQKQAIVAYPVKGGKTDLTDGTVLSILGENQPVHGGKLIWDIQENSASYIEGNQKPADGFYISGNKSICLQKPESPLLLYAEPAWITDTRGDEVNRYPIVKIGGQYWMKSNLAAKYYNDNSKITQKTGTNYSKTTAGFFLNGGNIFYNQEAVCSGKLAPEGWHIPTVEEWDKLKTYIGNNASVLKETDAWDNAEWPANNLTGFGATPIGIYTKSKSEDKSVFDFKGTYVGYWTSGAAQTETGGHIVMLSDKDAYLGNGTYSGFSGYSIRCIQDAQ